MIFKSYGGSIPPRATRVGVVIERCTVSEGYVGIFMSYPAPAPTPHTRNGPSIAAHYAGPLNPWKDNYGHYHMAACRRGS